MRSVLTSRGDGEGLPLGEGVGKPNQGWFSMSAIELLLRGSMMSME